MKRTVLVVSILLGLLFLLSGGSKMAEIRGPGMHTADFQSWGYPLWFMYVVGAWEVIGGVLLLVPSTRFYGASLMSVDMIGATVTTAHASQFNKLAFPLILLILLLWVAASLRPGAKQVQTNAS